MTEKDVNRRINKIYKESKSKINSLRFYRDFSEGYRYSIGIRDADADFISVSPPGSNLERLLRAKHHHSLSYDIERTIESSIMSLMLYGKAYIYIDSQYITIDKEDGSHNKILSSLQIGEIKGIITSLNSSEVEFWGFGPVGNIRKNVYPRSGFIEMSLKDVGYSKTYFNKISAKLDKYDVTASTLIYGGTDSYDFNEHMKRNTIKELKLTRKLGWISSSDSLSESQYLYRKITQAKFKMAMTKYVLESINKGIRSIDGVDSDEIVLANYYKIDYDEVWSKYVRGELTVSKLATMIH